MSEPLEGGELDPVGYVVTTIDGGLASTNLHPMFEDADEEAVDCIEKYGQAGVVFAVVPCPSPTAPEPNDA